MLRVDIVPARPEHLDYVAANLRPADIEEIMAASGLDAAAAVRESAALSLVCRGGLVNGEPVCVFGVGAASMAAPEGVIWLLGTPAMERHAVAFLRRNRAWIEAMLRLWPRLVNHVDARHTTAIRWLRWLGFTIHPAAPWGKAGLPFHRFERCRDV